MKQMIVDKLKKVFERKEGDSMSKFTERLLQVCAIAVLVWVCMNFYGTFVNTLITARQQAAQWQNTAVEMQKQAVALNKKLVECQESIK